MAELPDDFGRVGNFKSADFDSLADAIRSAVGKAVEQASGAASDSMKKEFDRLVDSMEELGDDIKESLKRTKEFVEGVKKAAEAMDGRRSARQQPAGADFAAAQREQTRILQMILKHQQRASESKTAKFTTGGSVLAAQAPAKRGLKDMGFRPRGADKIPAMLSPGEFVVSRRGTRGNEGALDRINRGYMRGGKVKPAYLAEGSWVDWLKGPKGAGGKAARIKAMLDLELDPKERAEMKQLFGELGRDVEMEFDDEFSQGLRASAAKWATGLTAAFVGADPFAKLFEGGVKDITEFRLEMRKLAFQTEGITGEFRNAQAEFARIGQDITARTGKNQTAFQKAYLANARKGYKDQKVAMKTMESGLKLSTLIGSETQATAALFSDWHRELNLGAVEMERMANSMQQVARRTGVTGDELTGVMKASEQILKNLRKQGTLTTTAAGNIVESMAQFKKEGFEDMGQRLLTAMSGYDAFEGADERTKNLLGVAANLGIGQGGYQDLMFGNIPQDAEKMGQMGEGIKKAMAGVLGMKPEDFNIDMLTKEQMQTLTVGMQRTFGVGVAEARSAMENFEKQAKGIGGTLADLDKARNDKSATAGQRAESEKKMNETLLSSSMNLIQSVQQATDKMGDKSLQEIGKVLGGDNAFGRDFATGTKELADISSYLSAATKNQFGLSGAKDQMALQIKSMDAEKQMQLRSMAAAEQLDKTMKENGTGSKDFAGKMKKALASGDTKKFKALAEEMGSAYSEAQVKEAAGVDPMVELEQTMSELNETMRNLLSPFVGGILDFVGSTGLLLLEIGSMASVIYNTLGGNFIEHLGKLEGIGTTLTKFFTPFSKGFNRAIASGSTTTQAVMRGFHGQFMSQFGAFIKGPMGKMFQKALGPAVLLLGGIKGVMEAEKAGRTKTEGFILGALTGGAGTGSFLSSTLGIEKGSATDKTLGVAGAAGWGAMAGAAIGASLAPFTAGLSIPAFAVVGAIIGGLMEVVKIITEGTDILADLFAPFQAIGNWLSGLASDLWKVLKSIVTLNVGGVISGIFGIISKTIHAFFAVIFGTIRMFVIGLPRLVLRALSMLWELPRMMMQSIKDALADLANNEWVGPIFKTLSVAFNAIYDGFMAIWTPISEIFSGLGRVFSDLGKALFGSAEGASFLSGVVFVLKTAVWSLSYVISWLLSPVILLAKAIGGVLWVVGKTIQGIIWPFQYLYDVLVGHSIVPDLVFGIIKFFAMLPFKVMRAIAKLPIILIKSLLKMPMMLWEGMQAGIGIVRDALEGSWEYAKSLFDLKGWAKWTSNLGTFVYNGFKSALQGVWDWIQSWVPGLKSVTKGFGESAEEQEATRRSQGNSITHAAGGLVGAVGSLLKGNLSEAGGKAWSSTKETAGAAWDGVKAVGSYLNPFSYFKEGTKKIDKAGLAMLHAGEMVVPKNMVDKIAAIGTGAFGSMSSFVKGGEGKEPGYKGLLGSLSERIKGLGSSFGECCPGDAVGDANEVMSSIPGAIKEAIGKVDDDSLLGKIKGQFTKASEHTSKFFKPLTTGFTRARKRGEGFIGSITKGLSSQYMDMTKGGVGESLSRGSEWLKGSIFGEKEGKDTKKGILDRIKEGIFGSKEGEDTKKGILGVVKEGLFGSGDDVKKGLFQIAKEGIFGKEGGGQGIFGWAKEKVFGQKMGEGEMGPPKPGLADAAKSSASSLWRTMKDRLEVNTEDGMINGAKNAAKKMYGKAKNRLFGQKMAEGEMGPPKPGLLDKAKGKAGDLYGKAKDRLFGKGAAESVASAAEADSKNPGKMENFKEKMKNIAEGVKEFSGVKVLAGALNLIPTSLGLTAMMPGSVGAKMLQKIDGEGVKKSLTGLAEGVSSLAKAKVLAGAAAMVLVGIASLGLIPAIPMFALLGAVAPLVEGGLKSLGKGLGFFGKAAANPYTWLGVALLAAINVAMIPLAYALRLAAPAVEAFGKAIKSAFEGAGSLLKAVGESIGMILKEITISKALALGVAAIGIGALGVAMAAFAAGGFIASWIDYFSGDGVFTKIMELAEMAPNLAVAAASVDKLGEAFKNFAQNKSGGWTEWLLGSDGVIAGFKRLSEVGTPEFHASAESIHKMADGLERMQGVVATPAQAETGTATAAGEPTKDVEPVHLRDITGSILRDKTSAKGGKLQSDELTRMEEASHKQVSELEQIRQGINELVSLMRPRGSIVGGTEDMQGARTKDPRRPMHAVRFGKMKYGTIGGQANRSFVSNGEV